MQQYQTFVFDSYGFDESAKRIELRYILDDAVSFVETIQLPADKPFAITDRAALDRALFLLHLIGGISYYKTCLPKTIEIRSGSLNTEQAAFWNTVYTQGLGEFFYRNEIDFRGLIRFPSHSDKAPLPPSGERGLGERGMSVLIPIGGGKDSIVTLELLKKTKLPITLLRVGHHLLIDEIAKIAGLPLLTVDRRLDPLLFKLNTEGALNGHVPITAYISCLTIVLCELYGFTHSVFSDERSADEGNVELHGMTVNHQWSKSIEFERALRSYIASSVSGNIEYFSLLRPLSELKIVELFTQYPQYFEHFTSCNTNWKILGERSAQKWCGKCPKCAFVFAMFSAFLPKADVIKIFDGNLFEDSALLALYKELLGLEGIKPFECVGTPEETYAALMLASEQEGWEETPIMKMFEKDASSLFPKADTIIDRLLAPSSDHCIPVEFQPLVL